MGKGFLCPVFCAGIAGIATSGDDPRLLASWRRIQRTRGGTERSTAFTGYVAQLRFVCRGQWRESAFPASRHSFAFGYVYAAQPDRRRLASADFFFPCRLL